MNSQAPAKSLRPGSRKSALCFAFVLTLRALRVALLLVGSGAVARFLATRRLVVARKICASLLPAIAEAREELAEIVPQFHLHSGAAHDDVLLDHRQRVVAGPVDHEAGGEGAQHEREDH